MIGTYLLPCTPLENTTVPPCWMMMQKFLERLSQDSMTVMRRQRFVSGKKWSPNLQSFHSPYSQKSPGMRKLDYLHQAGYSSSNTYQDHHVQMKGLQIIDMLSVHLVDDASLYAHYQDPKGHMNPIPRIYAIL